MSRIRHPIHHTGARSRRRLRVLLGGAAFTVAVAIGLALHHWNPRTPEIDSSGVYPRSAWTSVKPDFAQLAPMDYVRQITIHHEGSNVVAFSDPARTGRRIEAIRRHHRDRQGWGDIGYHYVIDLAGDIWEARDSKFQGAHAGSAALNRNNLGVMLLGNFDQQALASPQIRTLESSLDAWLTEFGLDRSAVTLHGDLKQTDCPGEAVRAWYRDWSTVR